jgi:MFS family permease
MVIITLGELTLVPTATKFVADLAPAEMRGRYMSVYWLSWGISRAFAPMVGGFLHDQISPQAIWYGGLVLGLISTAGLAWMAARANRQKTPQRQEETIG